MAAIAALACAALCKSMGNVGTTIRDVSSADEKHGAVSSLSQPPPRKKRRRAPVTTTRLLVPLPKSELPVFFWRVPRAVLTDLINMLRPQDITQFATVRKGQGLLRELLALHTYQVYSLSDEKKLLTMPEIAFDRRMQTSLSTLVSLQLLRPLITPTPETWRSLMTDAPRLRAIELVFRNIHGQLVGQLLAMLRFALPRLRSIHLGMPSIRQLEHLALDSWTGHQAVQPFPLESLRIVAGRGASLVNIQPIITSFPQLRYLNLKIEWTNDTLVRLRDGLRLLEIVRLHSARGGPWMAADTLATWLRDTPSLQLLSLVKNQMKLHITGRDRFEFLRDADDEQEELGDEMHESHMADILTSGITTRWGHVWLELSTLAVVRTLIPKTQATGTKIGTFLLTRNDMYTFDGNDHEIGEWEDDDAPWLTKDEVRGLLSFAERTQLSGTASPPRAIIYGGDVLTCNRLSDHSIFAWIRAIPAGKLHCIEIGSAGEGVEDNPDDTPQWSDEICRQLILQKDIHSGTFQALHIFGRGQLGESKWSGTTVLAFLAAYPRLTRLLIHDAGPVVDRIGEIVDAWRGTHLSLWSTQHLRHSRVLDRLRNQVELHLNLGAPPEEYAPATKERVAGFCARNPLLKRLELDVGFGWFQSLPTMDWRPFGHLQALERLRLAFDSIGVTTDEILMMIGPALTSLRLDVDPDTMPRLAHRMPTPAQQDEFMATEIPAGHGKTIDDILNFDAEESRSHGMPDWLLTWADEKAEGALILPTLVAVTAKSRLREDTATNDIQRWRWLARQPGMDARFEHVKGLWDRHVVTGRMDAPMRVIYVDPRNLGHDPVTFIQRPHPSGTGFVTEAICITHLVDRNVSTKAILSGLVVSLPKPIWSSEIVPTLWRRPEEVEVVWIHVLFAHLCLLNPRVSAAAIAQFLFRPFGEVAPLARPYWKHMEREARAEIYDLDPYSELKEPTPPPTTSSSSAGSATLSDRATTAPRSVAHPSRPHATDVADERIVDAVLHATQQALVLDPESEAARALQSHEYVLDLTHHPQLDSSSSAQIVSLVVRRNNGGQRTVVLTVRNPNLVDRLTTVLAPLLHSAANLHLIVQPQPIAVE